MSVMTGKLPLVSIVIPTYNHAEFLKEALDSVRAQTVCDWEAIVVNNFSTDSTHAVVAAQRDERIKIIDFANKGVIAASRNQGIALAKGEFLAFLDSDDIWQPQKFERCLIRLAEGFDLVCHGESWVRDGGDSRDVLYGPESRATFNALLFEGNCISTSAVVVRREWLARVGGFDESGDLVTAEDYHLWLKLAQAGARIGFVPEILGTYRIHAGNQSRAVLRNVEATRAAFQVMLTKLPQSWAVRVKAWRRQAILDYSGARGLQDNGEHAGAWLWFVKAILRWPFSPKFYAACVLNGLHRRLLR